MTEVDWEKLSAEVEAVARAMYTARVGDCRNCYEFDELNSEGQHHVFDSLIIEAKAAIQALAFPAIKAERDAQDATIRALQEEVGEMREEYTPKHAAWDAACSVPRKVQKKIAAALIFAANVKYNLDQGAWADCPERYRAEFYRFAEDIQATLKDTPND